MDYKTSVILKEFEEWKKMAKANLERSKQKTKDMCYTTRSIGYIDLDWTTSTYYKAGNKFCKESDMEKKDIRFVTIVKALEDYFDDRYSAAFTKEERRLEEEYRKSPEFVELLELHNKYKELNKQSKELPFYKWAASVKLQRELEYLLKNISDKVNKSTTLRKAYFTDKQYITLGDWEYYFYIKVDRDILPTRYTRNEIEARLYLLDGWENLSFNELVKTFNND